MRKWKKYKNKIQNCGVVIYYDGIVYKKGGIKVLYKDGVMIARLDGAEIMEEVD